MIDMPFGDRLVRRSVAWGWSSLNGSEVKIFNETAELVVMTLGFAFEKVLIFKAWLVGERCTRDTQYAMNYECSNAVQKQCLLTLAQLTLEHFLKF